MSDDHYYAYDDDDDSWEGAAGDWSPNAEDMSLLTQLGIEFVPPKYWRSNGYSRDHAYCLMPHLQQLILRETRDVMNGDYRLQDYEKKKYDAQVTILHWLRKNGRIENHNPARRVVIPHDDALLPMWRALAGAIRNDPSGRFKLDFTGVELTKNLLEVIFESFGGKDIITALFRSANLNREALGSILSFAAARPELSSLYLDQNVIFRDPAIILESFSSMQHVASLHVTRCQINVEGAKVLSNILQGNPLLRDLDISHNQVGDDGVQWLAVGLKANTNLRLLHMEDNAVTRVGHGHLLTALMDRSSLSSIIASNHSCEMMSYDGSARWTNLDDVYEQLLDGPVDSTSALQYAAGCHYYSGRTPANSAARKILFAVREDVQRCPVYFVDLGLGVLPRLLRLLQLAPSCIEKKFPAGLSWNAWLELVEDRRVLSSVFETMKCFGPELAACANGRRLSKRKRDD
ncbi:hypothetical protein THAOC_30832 [Thalassiosira oceanica]|uniref:Uncharacterized protein n=1 Tax=Thalassiosira oceanica TaxID=159749 RepID=K0RDA9_THAOC|nr:hypothetical protein THAOC_30832 [Thalassiosira oceanica]|mmetsp:Transcript_34747/g.77995  ORF Transcript_34747/g.77995 Transcript_34747/m.77995 type:complete len:461 (+) Transcript_34747:124-1506(+)|eukprot:EJK50224.1 hypothetical protein THAOC_30832 [Thalassiosira oceanica]